MLSDTKFDEVDLTRFTRFFGPGPVVYSPLAATVKDMHHAAVAAVAGYSAARAWPQAPNPVSADDLWPERASNGDQLARTALIEQVYQPRSRFTEQTMSKRKESSMLGNTNAASNIAVRDLNAAKKFYEETIGLQPLIGNHRLFRRSFYDLGQQVEDLSAKGNRSRGTPGGGYSGRSRYRAEAVA